MLYDFEKICMELNTWLFPNNDEHYQRVFYQSDGYSWDISWGEYCIACSELETWWEKWGEDGTDNTYMAQDEFIEECKDILAKFIGSMTNLAERVAYNQKINKELI
jgi:Ni,Fe-hydrogenase I small subunit